jgi:hypothetical protein
VILSTTNSAKQISAAFAGPPMTLMWGQRQVRGSSRDERSVLYETMTLAAAGQVKPKQAQQPGRLSQATTWTSFRVNDDVAGDDMANAAVQKETGGTPSFAQALWDPFGFMREMFGWGRSVDVPSFDVKETDDAPSVDVKETDGAYICKFKLTLPGPADVARVKAELYNGELTLVVPKAAAATAEPASPPPKTRGKKGNGRRSAARSPRRGVGSRSRRG